MYAACPASIKIVEDRLVLCERTVRVVRGDVAVAVPGVRIAVVAEHGVCVNGQSVRPSGVSSTTR